MYAPEITKNLLSVSQITHDNDVFAKFHFDHCLFKDKTMKKVLLRGTLRGGLYQLDVSKLQDGFKIGDFASSTSLYKVNNKDCSLFNGSVKNCLLSSTSLFLGVAHSSSSAESLIQSTNKNDHCISDSNSTATAVTCKFANLWHSRLGHPLSFGSSLKKRFLMMYYLV